MLIRFSGQVQATPSSMTVVFNGTEVFSGVVGSGEPLNTIIDLATYNWNSTTWGETASVSISVTAGLVTIGSVGDGEEGFPPGDDRISSSILINGSAPEWPATPVEPMPKGTEENPDWTYWNFELGAGETMTFNIANNGVIDVWAPNTNYSAGQMIVQRQVYYITNADCNSGSVFNASQFTPA